MYLFEYSYERKLPNGAWQRVTGSVTASSESEVERNILRNEISAVRNISIRRR